MARQRDRHHARPRDRPARGSRGPHHPAQGFQGRPSARGQAPSLRPGLNHLRKGGLPPGIGHALPDPLVPAPLSPKGTVPWIWAIPSAHTQVEAGPDTRPKPPPEPQQSLTCGYHAIHRVLSRVGLSPKLAYPLPTTDQEVHQIRRLVCEILAAAAEDGKHHLQTARPTTCHASAPQRADTYTDTTHPNAQSPPEPLPSRCPPGDAHTPIIARTPGPRDTGLPHLPEHQHTTATLPPAGHPSPPPPTRQPTHTSREKPRAPRHTRPTQWPAHAPRTHPRRSRPSPPGP